MSAPLGPMEESSGLEVMLADRRRLDDAEVGGGGCERDAGGVVMLP